MARNNGNTAISAIPADEIAEVIAANDLTASGRSVTLVDTNTVVEDRTEASGDDALVEYHSEDSQLDGGTVLTSYGEAKA